MNLCLFEVWSACQPLNGYDNLCLAIGMSFLEFIPKVIICLSPAKLSGIMAAKQWNGGEWNWDFVGMNSLIKMFLFEMMETLGQNM